MGEPVGYIGDPLITSVFNTTAAPSEFFDGIFLPGSAYFELHSTLRSHMFDTARSRACSKEPVLNYELPDGDDIIAGSTWNTKDSRLLGPGSHPSTSTPKAAELTIEEEYRLWKNWTDEIAPWVGSARYVTTQPTDYFELDKFDNQSHFGRSLPLLAKNHLHLRCSILALSARQIERKSNSRSTLGSLALYQEAVHQLIPHLDTRTSAVVASCVVLCVLEMMSCK